MTGLKNSQTTSNKLSLWLALALLLLAAFALRIHRLDTVPLRGDEAFAAVHWTKTPFYDDWMSMIEYEPNPGAQISYWAWSEQTGTSEFALRYLPLLSGVLGLAIAIALTKYLQSEWKVAFAVGILWAVNPFFLWHSQDARQYSMLTALTPLNFYLLLRAIDRDQRRDWVIYLFFQTFTIYLYYIELFWVAAQGLYVISLKRRAVLEKSVKAWVLVCLLLIPLFLQTYYVLFVHGYEGTAVYAEFGQLFSQVLPTLFFGENEIPVLTGILIFAAIVVGIWKFAEKRVLLLSWMLVPMTLFYLIATQTSFFNPRYVIAVAPVLLIGLTIALFGFSKNLDKWAKTLVPGIFMIGMCTLSLAEINDYFYHDQPKAQDWYSLVDYLQEHTSPEDDLIIFGHPSPDIEYYYTGQGNLFMAADDWGALPADIEQMLFTYRDLVVIASEYTIDVGQYLYEHAQHIPGDTHPGTIRYRNWDVDAAEIENPLNIQFGDVALLRGYSIIADTTLLLYWEALATTETEYSVLLHLETAPDALPVHVLDHALAGSIVSAQTWTPGVIYRDPVALPVDLAADDYTMRIGFYVYGTNERLTIVGTDDQYDGRYPVGVLSIIR